jgi:hypothetical protein
MTCQWGFTKEEFLSIFQDLPENVSDTDSAGPSSDDSEYEISECETTHSDSEDEDHVPGRETTDNEDMLEQTITTNPPAHGNQKQGSKLFTWKLLWF